jgi:hypothetical protein
MRAAGGSTAEGSKVPDAPDGNGHDRHPRRGRRARATHEHDGLPEPPQVPRRIRLGWTHLTGMALLLAAPVLAAVGVLDPVQHETSATNDQLKLTAHFPARLRYRTNGWVRISVHNRSDRPASKVTVSVDPAYLQAFNPVTLVPSPDRAFETDLGDLRPGETRHIALQLQAEEYGRRRGGVSAAVAGQPPVEVPIGTLVLP